MCVDTVLDSIVGPILHSLLVVPYIHTLAVISWWVFFILWFWTWPCDLFWPMGCELTRCENLEMFLCDWSCSLVFDDTPREEPWLTLAPSPWPLNKECGIGSIRTWRAAPDRATWLNPVKIDRTSASSWVHVHENEWLLLKFWGGLLGSVIVEMPYPYTSMSCYLSVYHGNPSLISE